MCAFPISVINPSYHIIPSIPEDVVKGSWNYRMILVQTMLKSRHLKGLQQVHGKKKAHYEETACA